jgi:hypothetical protein
MEDIIGLWAAQKSRALSLFYCSRQGLFAPRNTVFVPLGMPTG